MTTTPNYGFKIAEGTDTVNLLTQSYPNFTDLDSILKSIELTGITSSVATKAGTVFNIVRTNADLNVLKFVATSNYASGDTFTVDGVSVTATAVDGTALPAGAFVINQTVMALLNGTVLTVLVGGGNAGSIEAEDVDYDNTGSGLTATDVQAAIDELAARPVVAAAEDVTYDNTVSGLTATDVQAAIDELKALIPATPQYTTTGLSIYQNRAIINSGGYYIDNGFCYVDITLTVQYSDSNPSANYRSIDGFPEAAVSGNVTPVFNQGQITKSAAGTNMSVIGAITSGTSRHFVGSYQIL